MRIKSQKDFLAGIMFVALGVFFSGFGTKYKFGSAANMGPGYFPTVLGILMLLLGAIVTFTALSSKAKEDSVEKFDWFATLWVLGSIVLFGIMLKPVGLVFSLLGLVLASSYASPEFHWKSALINAVVLMVMCFGIFIYGLKLEIQLWPSFLLTY